MFRRLFRRIFGGSTAPVQSTPQNPSPVIPANPDADITFAFIIGHNEWDQGVRNFLGESEWSFNSRVAKRACEILAEDYGKSAYILFRPSGSYTAQVNHVVREARRLKVNKALSLHFNAFSNPTVQGTEALIVSTPTPKDDLMAKILTDMLAQEYGVSQRGTQGVKTIPSGHGGYGMLRGLSRAGITATLIEPVFATHDTPETRDFFNREYKYAKLLAKFANKVIEQNF